MAPYGLIMAYGTLWLMHGTVWTRDTRSFDAAYHRSDADLVVSGSSPTHPFWVGTPSEAQHQGYCWTDRRQCVQIMRLKLNVLPHTPPPSLPPFLSRPRRSRPAPPRRVRSSLRVRSFAFGQPDAARAA